MSKRSLLEALAAFNRRERHILVGWVLDRLTFPLGHEFRDALNEVLPSHARAPADSYVAMNYGLNWLFAALLWSSGQAEEQVPRLVDSDVGIDLHDNSDSDLVLAFARGSNTYVVLLEAKGYTRWATKQLEHKLMRLKEIFGEDGDRFREVVPYWVLVSPDTSPALNWASWMIDPDTGAIRHLPLPQPSGHKFAVARCDSEGRKRDAGYWKIRYDPWPGPS